MTFQEMIAQLNTGARIGSVTVFGADSGEYLTLEDGKVMVAEDGDSIDTLGLDLEVLSATDYYVIPVAEDRPTIVAYYDTAARRWRSTTNAEEHRRRGHQVKTFVAQD